MKSKNILIYGLGKEGTAAALYLLKNNKVAVIDDKKRQDFEKETIDKLKKSGVELFFEGNLPESDFDYIVRSPGVKPVSSLLNHFAKSGAKVVSSTGIFFDNCPAQIIGVTGTKGKGTTSTLIYEILKSAGLDAYIAGNIGTPMLEILPKLSEKSVVVLELSSFQLIDLTKSPHIAVVLMVTSEHLDWHTDQSEYHRAKSAIVRFQKPNDFAIINWDFPASKDFSQMTVAKVISFSTLQNRADIILEEGAVVSKIEGYKDTILDTKIIKLPGRHNLQNICAAVGAALAMGIKKEDIEKAVSTFSGLPNRLELVAKINGVSYYNDSFSTTPETSIAAIKAFESPKIVILGGSSKKSNFSDLAKVIATTGSIRAVILIGHEAKTIKIQLEKYKLRIPISEGAKSMKEIIAQTLKFSEPGDIVLLSPACASFDMFKNYHERGDQFRREVLKITK